MAHAVIKRGNSPVQYRKYEKNMLPKHNQGAQMHSVHGRQNFEAYWNFSLTFPELLATLPNPGSHPHPPAVRPHAVSARGNVPRTRLCATSRVHASTAGKCLPVLRFEST